MNRLASTDESRVRLRRLDPSVPEELQAPPVRVVREEERHPIVGRQVTAAEELTNIRGC